MVLNSTLCSPTADIKYKNWPGYFVYFPWPKSNSMLAPLILSPTCIVLILIPTRYPLCSGYVMSWKTPIWKPPLTYFPPSCMSELKNLACHKGSIDKYHYTMF